MIVRISFNAELDHLDQLAPILEDVRYRYPAVSEMYEGFQVDPEAEVLLP